MNYELRITNYVLRVNQYLYYVQSTQYVKELILVSSFWFQVLSWAKPRNLKLFFLRFSASPLRFSA